MKRRRVPSTRDWRAVQSNGSVICVHTLHSARERETGWCWYVCQVRERERKCVQALVFLKEGWRERNLEESAHLFIHIFWLYKCVLCILTKYIYKSVSRNTKGERERESEEWDEKHKNSDCEVGRRMSETRYLYVGMIPNWLHLYFFVLDWREREREKIWERSSWWDLFFWCVSSLEQ